MMNLQYEAERFVLGSILQQPDLIDECYLHPEEFMDPDGRHKLVMEFMRYLHEDEGVPLDVMSVAQAAGDKLLKLGGISYLFELKDAVPSVANFDYYQSIVRQAYVKHKSVGMLGMLQDLGMRQEMDAKELVGKAQEAFEELAELTVTNQSDVVKMSEVLKDHHKTIRERQHKQGITGAKTASADLDLLTGGHQDGDFEVIGARPSIGKTAYIVDDMKKTAQAGRPAVMFSLEMTARQIAERFICNIGNIDNAKLRTGNLSDTDWERWSYAMEELDRLPIYIDDTPGMTLQDIQRKVKQLKKQHPRIVVYIDFLQLVNPGKRFSKEHEGVAYVSKGLKQIARKYECPVIAISAVSRKCEERQDKRPMMSDLRESGSIESDADIIIFLYRDDYYNPNTEKNGGKGLSIMELIVAKGRNVGTGTIEVAFDKKTGKILDLDRKHHEDKGGDSGGGAHNRKRGAGGKG
ncbi:replicative DNA helicase [Paenibacillus sp. Pae108]|uniref:replicative DNA helicase n=1 Tax=Paenibacillus sp. Pae108 TaxID=2926019 RepID=UPI002117887E|nr:replicative DNA helicase [Paenibacillus sp. Pae108]